MKVKKCGKNRRSVLSRKFSGRVNTQIVIRMVNEIDRYMSIPSEKVIRVHPFELYFACYSMWNTLNLNNWARSTPFGPYEMWAAPLFKRDSEVRASSAGARRRRQPVTVSCSILIFFRLPHSRQPARISPSIISPRDSMGQYGGKTATSSW